MTAKPINPAFTMRPDPDNPGWRLLPAGQTGLFHDIFGELRILVKADGKVRVRLVPQRRHENNQGSVHGGLLLSAIDHMLFIGPFAQGVSNALGGVTVDVTAQFFDAVAGASPFDTVVEILRETKLFIFLRRLIKQDGRNYVAFSGTIRKAR